MVVVNEKSYCKIKTNEVNFEYKKKSLIGAFRSGNKPLVLAEEEIYFSISIYAYYSNIYLSIFDKNNVTCYYKL